MTAHQIARSAAARVSRTGSQPWLLLLAAALTLSGCSLMPWHSEDNPTIPPPSAVGPSHSAQPEGGSLPARLAQLRQQEAADPGNARWAYQQGLAYAQADSAAQSERELRRALRLDPMLAPALSLLSEVLYRARRFQEAVDLLEEARANGAADRPELLADLALNYAALGQADRAQELVRGLAGPGPHWASAGSALTYVALRGNDFLHADEPARQALRANPAAAANHNNYGITRLHAGDPAGARESFLKAHELDPTLPGPLYNLAIVERFYFVDDAKGREWFDRYWALSQEDPDQLHKTFHPNADGGSVALHEK
jgi:tetratricopeptide (TPR) repeat protein